MAIPETVAQLDAAIAAEHAAVEAAIDTCQSGVAQWHVEQIARLEDLRPAIEAGTPALHELVRMRRRGLGEKYARACWGRQRRRRSQAADRDRTVGAGTTVKYLCDLCGQEIDLPVETESRALQPVGGPHTLLLNIDARPLRKHLEDDHSGPDGDGREPLPIPRTA
jgi:hypothetical protein